MRSRFVALTITALVVAGCATFPEQVAELDADSGVVELTDTPFFPQEEFQCGPAALATVLVQSGVSVSADDLVSQVYLPEKQGSLQLELLGATRASERIPYVIDQSMQAINAELLAARPVLVLQNLGIKSIPRWHYAVVVGIDPALGKVYLRSGVERRHETRLSTFLRTWQRSNYWALVALRPGELPARADPLRFAEAVSAFEQTADASAALLSWSAAAERWPENTAVLFGLANAQLGQAKFAQAEALYRKILAHHPNELMAGNNLAMALAKQGYYERALAEIEQVMLQADPEDYLLPEYRSTLQEIRALSESYARE